MAHITWTHQASKDLEQHYRYVAEQSQHYAEALVERIINTIERLEDFPLSGRVVPEFELYHIREVIVSNYRVVYRLKAERVEVPTIHHSSRPLSL